MTFNNSVLLKIKQAGSIEYNELFNSIVSNYSSPESARSALSRALKNLEAFGQIKRDGSTITITDKGLASINIEMKDKLVFRINELVKASEQLKNPVPCLEELVRLMIILSQRSEADEDLKRSARDNSTFSITDIKAVRNKISRQKEFLDRADSLLKGQVEKLEKLNFNDIHSEELSPVTKKKIIEFAKGKDISAEAFDEDFLKLLPGEWKKQNALFLKGEGLGKLFSALQKFPSSRTLLYISGIKIVLYGEKATFFGPFSLIKKFRKGDA